ncbi:MAG: hypothetical protein AUJ51_12670 [Elusimicrobia bacterium CG1_02_56_21]|nr:MAG: hypothetical protein AUJ51_12670 [Elusimicrobia bacterium CG1_02_56_21]
MEIKDAAVEKLKKIIKEVNKGPCLRIFMTEGCCGPSIAMDITPKPENGDREVVIKDLKVYVHNDAVAELVNAVIDCDKDGEILVTGLPSHGGDCCH